MSNKMHKGLGKSFGKMFGNDKVRSDFIKGNNDEKNDEIKIDLSNDNTTNNSLNQETVADQQNTATKEITAGQQATTNEPNTAGQHLSNNESTTESKSSTDSQSTAESQPIETSKESIDNQSNSISIHNQLAIDITLIQPNLNQPRKNFDETELRELSDSIKTYGVVEPLVVRKNGALYEIIAGERRWRAAKLAGLQKVPVVVKEYNDRTAREVALIENIQRSDLNPIEEALAYQSLIEEYGLTQEEVARKVSKNRSTVTNVLRILNLSKEIQDLLKDDKLTQGHARALLAIENEELREKIAKRVIDENLSVREIEKLVRLEGLAEYRDKKRKELNTDSMVQLKILLKDLERQLKHKYNTKVSINPKNEESGKVEFEYYSKDDLDRIFLLLNGNDTNNAN